MDINYLLFLQELRNASGGIFDSFVLSLTALGEASITWGLLALVYWCIDKRAGQLMALNVSFASTLNQGLKNIFKIERPWVRDERVVPVQSALSHAGGYSFPSGHATRGTAVWGAWAKRLWNQREKGLSLLCAAVCLVVAFTRNYLGVHTPQDVIVALVMGAVLIFALDYALEWTEKGENRDLIIGVIGCAIFLLLMLKVGCLTNAGAGVGILFGWIVERRWIKFETDGALGKRAFRFVLGCLVLVLFYTIPNVVLSLFMAGKYAGFFSNFLFAVMLMAGYPFVFSKLEKMEDAEKKLTLSILGLAVILIIIGTGAYKAKVSMENAAANESLQENAGTTDIANEPVQVIAHRGYSSEFPENTLAAFEGACNLGVDYIEMDVQATKDGVLVMFHDTELVRITGASGNVIDYTYEELCALDAGSWFHADFAGEKIPTLDETLAYLQEQDCRIYLELKDIGAVEGFAESVAATAANYGMTERCVFASFNYEYLKQIKAYDENAQVLYNTMSDQAEVVNEFPAEYYGLYLESVSAELVNAIHDAGSQAFVWTVDARADMLRLIELGVDGICTNKPGLAKATISID